MRCRGRILVRGVKDCYFSPSGRRGRSKSAFGVGCEKCAGTARIRQGGLVRDYCQTRKPRPRDMRVEDEWLRGLARRVLFCLMLGLVVLSFALSVHAVTVLVCSAVLTAVAVYPTVGYFLEAVETHGIRQKWLGEAACSCQPWGGMWVRTGARPAGPADLRMRSALRMIVQNDLWIEQVACCRSWVVPRRMGSGSGKADGARRLPSLRDRTKSHPRRRRSSAFASTLARRKAARRAVSRFRPLRKTVESGIQISELLFTTEVAASPPKRSCSITSRNAKRVI